MRESMVVGTPTTRTAITVSTMATTTSAAIFHRPERPSERFLTIFIQSSTNPMAPHASVVNSTVIAAVLRDDRMRKGTAMAKRISRPPMVGVPCFSAWPSGISPCGRMNCPTSWSRSHRVNRGPRKSTSMAAPMAAMRMRGTG